MSGHRFVFDAEEAIIDLGFWEKEIRKNAVYQHPENPEWTVVEVAEDLNPIDYKWIALHLLHKDKEK